MEVSEDRVQWQASVIAVLNFRVLIVVRTAQFTEIFPFLIL